MSTLLWQKDGVEIDARIQRFLAGDDVVLDREFLRYDIRASREHARGLAAIGILSAEEFARIDGVLSRLDGDVEAGRFVLDERYEDGHSAIEAVLIEELGDTGRRIHTGRSRNDQVLVATRLWLLDRLDALRALCVDCARVALDRAADEMLQPMPGYTHLQRAVVSSTGAWWAAWAEAFVDNAWRARQTREWIDADPLGTAAGYGINLPLPREATGRALGFGRMQASPGYAQLSRGKFEMAALEAVGAALLDVRRLAWDLSLFTTSEFGFVRMPARYVTGSSIMPNKRNPDAIELLRASYAPVAAARAEIEQVLSLPSGYHRDLQFTKGPVVRGIEHGLAALALLPELLRSLEWRVEALDAALEPSMYATDLAIDLARQGIPFREAYVQAADPARWAAGDAVGSLRARVSPGAPGAPALDAVRARLDAIAS
ncbi:lyase family protein [Lysobacter sp. N42]|uniref:lyase family protein n=1 Tax=Lysobacter sp. N42 TaxID=2545719 RepID=UPI001042D621|nr:lyase family protein [Lysobacter sp. N42]TCZ88115.1 argininosuccinate lyase [Lysobacter sp. N42]